MREVGDELWGLSQWVQLYTPISFGDLTPYLSYGCNSWLGRGHPSLVSLVVTSFILDLIVWGGEEGNPLEERVAEAGNDAGLAARPHHRVGLPRPSLPVGQDARVVTLPINKLQSNQSFIWSWNWCTLGTRFTRLLVKNITVGYNQQPSFFLSCIYCIAQIALSKSLFFPSRTKWCSFYKNPDFSCSCCVERVLCVVYLFGNAPICASTVLECSCCRTHRYVAAPADLVYIL